MIPSAVATAADVPVEVGRDEARRAARAELADPVYQEAQPSLITRVIDWVSARIGELLAALTDATPGGTAGLVLVLLLAVALAVAVRRRAGRLAHARRIRQAAVFGPVTRTAAEHRHAARRAAERGDLDDAVRERFRAVVRSLEERGVLESRAGRTAHEAAAEAGQRLADLAADLRAGAVLFDQVHYGGRTATREDLATVTRLDDLARDSRPAPT